MRLTTRKTYSRARQEEIHFALRSPSGEVLLLRHPLDEDGWSGFLKLPSRITAPDTSSSRDLRRAPHTASRRPASARGVSEATIAAMRGVIGDHRVTDTRVVQRFTLPRLSPVVRTIHLVEVHLQGTPTMEGAAWISTEEVWSLWHQGRTLLDPVVLAYLGRLHGDQAIPAPAQAIRIRPDVYLMALKTPTIPPATRTNTFVITGPDPVVIDPGTPLPGQQRRLLNTLETLSVQESQAVTVLLTHHHPDHTSAVQAIRRTRPTVVAAHSETAVRIAPSVRVDRILEDGQQVRAGRRRLTCLATPGHAPGHLCFLDEVDGTLFAGDLVAGRGTVVIDPDEGDLWAYLRSLKQIRAAGPSVLLPAHGPPAAAAESFLDTYIRHRHERIREILNALSRGPGTVAGVTGDLYGDLPFMARRLGKRTIQAHLDALAQAGLVVKTGRRYRLTPQGESALGTPFDP